MQKKVIVTGGASGIGFAIARRFYADGASVFICDIAPDALEGALADIPGMQGATADVGVNEDVERCFIQAVEAMDGVTTLINNAGIGGPRGNIEDLSADDWDDCIRTNLSSIFYWSKRAIPLMKAQGGGSIINVSTTSAKTGLPGRAPYVASKAGVLGLTYNMARELGVHQIRCNAILPGLIDNPRGRLLVEKLAAAQGTTVADSEEEYLRYISMRTWIQPDEVAEVACFLASDRARHITGQEIAVDGNIEWEQ